MPTFTPKILSFQHVENVKNVEKIAYFRGGGGGGGGGKDFFDGTYDEKYPWG